MTAETDEMTNPHHLVLGTLADVLTGETLEDTHDERYRQRLAQYLIKEKGFKRTDLKPRLRVPIEACGKQARIFLDLAVRINDRWAMVVRYGPGSVVTRHQPAIAMARALADYQVPITVAYNGETADVLDGVTGKLIGSGLSAIPNRTELTQRIQAHPFDPLPSKTVEMAHQILYAFDIDDSCPCDTTQCRL